MNFRYLFLFIVTFSANAEYQTITDPTQAIIQGMGRKNLESSKKTEKAVREQMKEYQNRANANAIYQQKHPNAPRVETSLPNFARAINAEKQRPEYRNDTDPHANPTEWDSMKSKEKICYFHKGTRRKVCEPL